MAPDRSETAYLDFAARSRGLVAGVALLLVGEPERADRLAQTVLARRVPAHGPARELLSTALAEVVRPRPGWFSPPWSAASRVELVDAGAARPPRPVLLAELQQLPLEQRAAVVLGQYAGLSAEAVAGVLGSDVPAVERAVQLAYRTLAAGRPERLLPGRLAEELRSTAASASGGPSGDPTSDLRHGRRLERRRLTRRASALVAAVLVVVVGATTVLGSRPEVPESSDVPSTSASSPSPDPRVAALCDVREPTCQATVMRAWRAEMARVIASHLDPSGRYFSGYTFSYDERYESSGFWAGGDGALGLEVYRLDGGATEVYLQVASSYATATRCGSTTGGRCEGLRFMDGNRFTLSTSTQLSKGLEVQHRPDGDQVITIAARNTSRGRVLALTRADLIDLVQDPRLRLPVI